MMSLRRHTNIDWSRADFLSQSMTAIPAATFHICITSLLCWVKLHIKTPLSGEKTQTQYYVQMILDLDSQSTFQGHSEGVDNEMNGFTLAFLKLLSSRITFEQPNGTRNIFTKSLGLISM